MRLLKTILLGCGALILVAASFPPPVGHVNDFAKVLSEESRSELENISAQFQQRSGVQLAIVTMNLAGESIEDTAPRLFKEWGIGRKEKDDGILVLLAPDIHQVRIETGYGIEGILPDAAAGRIVRDVMIPHFRDGDMEGGLKLGVMTVMGHVAKGLGIEMQGLADVGLSGSDRDGLDRASRPATPAWIRILLLLLFIYLFIRHPRLLLLMMMMSGGGGGGNRRGGFSSGGFGGFGGGLSGGGGAGGSW